MGWKTEPELIGLIDAERVNLYWRVPVDGVVPLPAPLRLPSTPNFDAARKIRSFSSLAFLKAIDFDALWNLSGDHTPVSETLADNSFGSKEGRIIERLHRIRERDPSIVRKAKAAFRVTHGRLFCEVCSFDFGQVYGEPDYIEAHHKTPLRDLIAEAETRLEDLAMVCANCHRMLHRGSTWPTIPQLKARLSPPRT